MKRSGYFIMVMVVFAVVFSLYFSGARCWAGERKYLMSGEMTAIDLDYKTVVIEVPLGERMFTGGGPLSSKAVLKRGGLLVDLVNFQVGDRVTVEWKVSEQGHLILVLKAK